MHAVKDLLLAEVCRLKVAQPLLRYLVEHLQQLKGHCEYAPGEGLFFIFNQYACEGTLPRQGLG